jgi:peptidoglycan/xylan/chitin deacetylase (PgdA/CDA1 family)
MMLIRFMKMGRKLWTLAVTVTAVSIAAVLVSVTVTGHVSVPSVFKQSSRVQKPSWTDCKGYVALTYDDGPDPYSTHKLLRELDNYGMKATFFVVGKHVEKYPQLAKEIATSGNDLQNHTYAHQDLRKFSSEQVQDDLGKAEAVITVATGQKPRFYRPPFGSTSPSVTAKTALQVGLTEVGWTLDTKDWEKENKSVEALKRKFAGIKAGDIVLMHDVGLLSTVNVIPEVSSILQSKHLCPGKLAKSAHPTLAWEGWVFYAKAVKW